jgi:hypothetical protein
MSQLPDGAIPFDHPDWSGSRQEWGYYVARADSDFLRIRDLTGKVVNVGTKDGLVYEAVTVVSFADGVLTIDGGRKGFPWSPERGVTEMTGPEAVHCHDIARGYVHPEGTTP